MIDAGKIEPNAVGAYGALLFDAATVERLVTELTERAGDDTERLWPRGKPEPSCPNGEIRGADAP